MCRCHCVAGSTRRRTRQRSGIDPLPSGALRVRVYSGMDPIAKRRIYLTEVAPAGPKAGDQAEKVGTRLLHQVETQPGHHSIVGQLLDRWLRVLDVDPTGDQTTYDGYIRKHIRPTLGGR
jgi:integrase